MKKIKFRAWHEKGKFFHYWGFTKGDSFFAGPAYLMDNNEQFTGLLDCEKKEIYEGDILEHAYMSIGGPIKEIGIVFWIGNGWRVEKMLETNPAGWMDGVWLKNMRVIGNIHENPELLRGKT